MNNNPFADTSLPLHLRTICANASLEHTRTMVLYGAANQRYEKFVNEHKKGDPALREAVVEADHKRYQAQMALDAAVNDLVKIIP